MNWAISAPWARAALVELAQQLRPCARPATSSGRCSIGSGVTACGIERPRLAALAAQRRGGFVGGPFQVGGVEPVDVGEVGGAAVDHAHRRRPPRRRTGPTRSATRRSTSTARRAVRRRPRRSGRRWPAPGEDALATPGSISSVRPPSFSGDLDHGGRRRRTARPRSPTRPACSVPRPPA